MQRAAAHVGLRETPPHVCTLSGVFADVHAAAKNDYVQLLLSVLNKLSKEQFQYLKYFEKKMDVVNEIRISKDIFEKEASDLGIHNLDDFYQSDTFTKKNRIEGKEILCQI